MSKCYSLDGRVVSMNAGIFIATRAILPSASDPRIFNDGKNSFKLSLPDAKDENGNPLLEFEIRFHIDKKSDRDSIFAALKALDHIFDAQAYVTSKGSHRGEEVIRIFSDGKEYARIYPCCWGHTANCHGTRIGGYSESLDHWVR